MNGMLILDSDPVDGTTAHANPSATFLMCE